MFDPYRKAPQPVEIHEGPEVPPLLPGLPHTPILHCKELMLAVIVQGLLDDDAHFVCSPTFLHYLLYLGLEPLAAINVKIAYLQGRIDKARLSEGALNVERTYEGVAWKSWPVVSV